MNPWWKKNGATLATLLLIFGVAMFIRLYFVYPAAFPDGLYSGGSDSYYWDRAIRYSFETGHQLVRDCELNYPICLTNPRPPMFQMFSLVVGWILAPLFAWNAWAAIVWVFLLSTALWGSLAIFPLYGLVKESFSRRAGLLAAFLLAASPASLQRSVASNADHDAFTLFFVVTAYYFFFRALRTMNERKWVESWRRPAAIKAGLVAFFRENRETTLYALLSAMSLTTIALSWQGWAYAPIILLVYLVVQLLVHRLRGVDPMGLMLVFALSVGPSLLLAAPWYVGFGQVRVWFDVPVYLFGGVLVLAVLLVVTRDYPWSIVVPGVLAATAAGIAAAALLNPAFATALSTGAGYFVPSKLYETIAEAQPPGLSQVILAFGWPLYFLSWAGIALMIYQAATGRRLQTPYLFFVVWAFAAIFMSQAAARFIFNASPAFAASAAYMFTTLINRFDYLAFKRSFSSLAGGNRIAAFRKSTKVRHVLGGFVIVLLLAPTVWYSVDAGIPFEDKHRYDIQIYDRAPPLLRPPNYEAVVGTSGSFYLGAFGFGLPLPSQAYPTAWRWLASNDVNVPPVDRPAYLSWWDYGFEAVDLGLHPAVADNFQDGVAFAGNFIAAQNESQSIALLSIRLLESDFYRNGNGRTFSEPVVDVLQAAGLDDAVILGAFQNPAALVPIVQGNPLTYGYYDPAMAPANARFIFLTQNLTSALSLEQLVDLYAALRGVTGWSIRYFAVDTRLFPQSASNTGIFYAPMKLSDRRVVTLRDGRTIPTDFYQILVNVGGQQIQIQDVQPTDQVSGAPVIHYETGFYDSMFYRAYIGFSPLDAGSYANGIPGFPQSGQPGAAQLAQMVPQQAWNLTHWRVVYRTAYYNPFDDVVNHSTAFQAVNYDVALEYQKEITAGTRTGHVDLSPPSLIQAGVVMVKYYDGAWVNGTVTVDGVVPVPGVRITVEDELNTPHYTTVTDAQGRYSTLVPFGEVKLVASVGAVQGTSLVGATVVNTTTLTITDAQAMREPTDADGDGRPDWLVHRDIVLSGHRASGIVFFDADRDRLRTATTEPVAAGAVVTASSRLLSLTRTVTTSSTGGYVVDHLPTGKYGLTVAAGGRNLTLADLDVPTTNVAIDLGLPTTDLTGRAVLASGGPAAGAAVSVRDDVNGAATTLSAGPDGRFSFPLALPGNFTVSASLGDFASPQVLVHVAGPSVTVDLTLEVSGLLAVRAWLDGNPQPFATLQFLELSSAVTTRTAVTNASGSLAIRLPEGKYSITSRVFRPTSHGTELWVFLGAATVGPGTTNIVATFVRGVEVKGTTYSERTTNVTKDTSVLFTGATGRYLLRTGALDGAYIAYLPRGTYKVQAVYLNAAFLGSTTFSVPTRFDIRLGPATEYFGTVFRDLNGDARPETGEEVAGAEVTLTDPQGGMLTEFTDTAGAFRAPLPTGTTYSMLVTRDGFAQVAFPSAGIAVIRERASIPLVALNITVSGVARFNGSGLTSTPLTVHFRAGGAGSVTTAATLDPSGGYSLRLAPGTYVVSVDEDVTPGVSATRWQLAADPGLTVAVGQPGAALDLTVVQRHRVAGNVTRDGSRVGSTIRFSGPDDRNVTATAGTYVVYLRPAAYNSSALALAGSPASGFLGTATIAGPTVQNFALVQSALVTGRLLVSGEPLSEVVPILFARSQGGALTASSQTTGAYAVSLPPGDYVVAVDHPSVAAIGGTVRHVRYTATEPLVVRAGDTGLAVDILLTRTLDNVTVAGIVRDGGVGAPAAFIFTARSDGAINATAIAAEDGRFTVALQPGTYSVYAVRASGDRAFLGSATFAAGVPAALDVALGPGIRVEGVTTYRGRTRVSATITFTGVATVSVPSGASTGYRVVLPPGRYAVSAFTTTVENGLDVRYSATASLNVTGLPPPLNLELLKNVVRGVRLSWDAAQRRTIAGGGSVTYTIAVENDGNVPETFSLIGSPAIWVSFPTISVPVGFGTVGNRGIASVVVHPPADALVLHPPIVITATSQGDPSVHGSVAVDVDIVRVRALGLNTTSPRFDGRFLNLTAVVANRGNDVERVDLVLANRAELDAVGWVGRFVGPNGTEPAVTNVIVAANSTVSVVVAFRPPGTATEALAAMTVSAVDVSSVRADTTASLSLPVLAGEGPVTATGPLLSSEAAVPYQLLAVVTSVAVVIGLTALLTLRRRRRRR